MELGNPKKEISNNRNDGITFNYHGTTQNFSQCLLTNALSCYWNDILFQAGTHTLSVGVGKSWMSSGCSLGLMSVGSLFQAIFHLIYPASHIWLPFRLTMLGNPFADYAIAVCR